MEGELFAISIGRSVKTLAVRAMVYSRKNRDLRANEELHDPE